MKINGLNKMDLIYVSRLKTHLCRRLETSQFVITKENHIKVLFLICEFVEQIKELGLMGEEKKALAISFYKRLITETVKTGVSLSINVYPPSQSNTINEQSEYIHFCENIASSLIDVVMEISKGQFYLNVKGDQREETEKANVKSRIRNFNKK